MASGGSDSSPEPDFYNDGEDCFRLSYPVYFTTNGNSDDGFSAQQVIITGQINSTQNNFEVDIAATEASAAVPFGNTFSFNSTDNTFVFEFFTTVGSADFIANGNSAPSFDNSFFEIILEAIPGEENLTVSLDDVQILFEGDTDLCDDILTVIPQSTIPEMPTPLSCSNSQILTIEESTEEVGAVDIKLKELEGNSVSFDLILLVSDINANLNDPTIEENLPGITSNSEQITQETQRIKIEGIQVDVDDFLGEANLVTIILGSPVSGLENEASAFTVEVELLRINETGVECCTPNYPQETITITGDGADAPCAAGFNTQFNFELLERVSCNSFDVKVSFSPNIPDAPIGLTASALDLGFRVETSGNWSAEISSDNAPCSTTPGACLFDYGVDCFEIMSSDISTSNTVFQINYGFCNNTPQPIEDIEFIVTFTGSDDFGCLENMGFNRAFIIENFSDGGCVPNTTPRLGSPNCLQDATNITDQFTVDVAYYHSITEGMENVLIDFEGVETFPTYTSCDAVENVVIFTNNCNNITIIPEDDDVYNGTCLTTFDLLLIRKHILTSELLDSPYKIIAADINNNGAVTAADLVAGRQVILGMATEFQNNNFEVYVDADFDFPINWAIADGYPSFATFDLRTSDRNAGFYGIKVGDVNETCGCEDGFTGGGGNNENFDVLVKEIVSRDYGYDFVIDLSSLSDKAAFQVGVDFDPADLQFIDLLVSSDLDEFRKTHEFGLQQTPDGKIYFLWTSPDAQEKAVNALNEDFRIKFSSSLSAEDLINKLVFNDLERSSSFGNSETFKLNSDFLNIAYDEEGNSSPVKLSIADEAIKGLLRENKSKILPNPFISSITLYRGNDISGEAEFNLYDANGRSVYNQAIEEKSSLIRLNLPQSLSNGVYYYTLSSSKDTISGKLVKQE